MALWIAVASVAPAWERGLKLIACTIDEGLTLDHTTEGEALGLADGQNGTGK